MKHAVAKILLRVAYRIDPSLATPIQKKPAEKKQKKISRRSTGITEEHIRNYIAAERMAELYMLKIFFLEILSIPTHHCLTVFTFKKMAQDSYCLSVFDDCMKQLLDEGLIHEIQPGLLQLTSEGIAAAGLKEAA